MSKVCLGSESYSLYQQNEMKLILDTNTNGSVFAQEQADTGTRGTANTGDRKTDEKLWGSGPTGELTKLQVYVYSLSARLT